MHGFKRGGFKPNSLFSCFYCLFPRENKLLWRRNLAQRFCRFILGHSRQKKGIRQKLRKGEGDCAMEARVVAIVTMVKFVHPLQKKQLFPFSLLLVYWARCFIICENSCLWRNLSLCEIRTKTDIICTSCRLLAVRVMTFSRHWEGPTVSSLL